MTLIKDYRDMTIFMNEDMQEDIDLLNKFIKEYDSGNEIVYGVRNDRKIALLFYRIMNKLVMNTIYNHADYRLVSKNIFRN